MFTITLWATLCQNPYKYESSNANTYNSSEHPISAPRSYPVTENYTPHEPVTNPYPNRDEWRTERDLIAQTDMANWAKWMFIVSCIMAFLSALGIWLILVTLRETREAGNKLSKQNEIALNASKAEFQPYLSFSKRIELDQLKITERYDNIIGAKATRDDYSFHISPEITATNKGKTPATEIYITHTGRIFHSRMGNPDSDGVRPIFRDSYDFTGSRKGPGL